MVRARDHVTRVLCPQPLGPCHRRARDIEKRFQGSPLNHIQPLVPASDLL